MRKNKEGRFEEFIFSIVKSLLKWKLIIKQYFGKFLPIN